MAYKEHHIPMTDENANFVQVENDITELAKRLTWVSTENLVEGF
jgi:hypothetical protein